MTRVLDDGTIQHDDGDTVYQWPDTESLARAFWACWRSPDRRSAADHDAAADSAVVDLAFAGDAHVLVVVRALIDLATVDELGIVGAGPLYDLAIWQKWQLLDAAIATASTEPRWRRALRLVILDDPAAPQSTVSAFQALFEAE